MSERHWPRPALAVLGAAALAGCGGHTASTTQASTTPKATAAADTGQASFTAAQMRKALLAKVSGQKPAAAAESGQYGTLPDVQTSKQTMTGVKVKPAKCAQAAVTGFNSGAFAHSPASVVTFRVGRDGVSEVLVSATSKDAATALADKLPSGCSHYSATVDGKTFKYTVHQANLAGPGDQARALNVKAAGYSAVNVWSVVFRGDGLLGAVTEVGPDSSKAGVVALAKKAYAHATQSLS